MSKYRTHIKIILKACVFFFLQLRRATVQNQKTGELEVAHYRISKSAWLKDDDHPVVATVRQRVEDITSLTVKTAEELQVVNYGIGGHYEPHFDFARVSIFESPRKETIIVFKKKLIELIRIVSIVFRKMKLMRSSHWVLVIVLLQPYSM